MIFFFPSQAARTVLHSAEPVSQMLNDWKQIDFEGIARQALWTFSHEVDEEYEVINERKRTEPVYLVLPCLIYFKPYKDGYVGFDNRFSLLCFRLQISKSLHSFWSSRPR